jgi:iron complex transport system substrate-binding protein
MTDAHGRFLNTRPPRPAALTAATPAAAGARWSFAPQAAAALLMATLVPLPVPMNAEASGLRLVDDQGQAVELPHPAARIVSLSPGLTETLFAAGAGGKLVGTVEFSNYPDAARRLPRIGNSSAVDIERILALRPDLIVAWPHGAAHRQLAQLRRLGPPVYVSDPRILDDLPATLEALGRLAGTEAAARAAADAFRMRLAGIRNTYVSLRPVGVFVQIWNRPLMTVNGRHVISDAVRACGGRNLFGELPAIAPEVDIESVIAADPAAIILVAAADPAARWARDWRTHRTIRAVRDGAMPAIPPELLAGLTPRTLDGLQMLCSLLQARRQKMQDSP